MANKTVKVVINRCYGGFSLSALGVKTYYAKKGVDVTFYKSVGIGSLKRITLEEAKGSFFTAFSRDLGETPQWSDEAHLDSRPEKRDDPDLVAVIEELGDAASGACAQLAIVKIPAGVEWVIDEYDGLECVEEKHRSWC